MADNELAKKLGLRPGSQALRLVNAPEGFAARLEPLPDGVHLASAEGPAEHLLVFLQDRATFDRLVGPALAELAYDGLCWLVYPKKSAGTGSDLSREVLWALMDGSGLRPVAQISIDEVWSALRFRPVEQVKSQK
jgi:hypothetical protein